MSMPRSFGRPCRYDPTPYYPPLRENWTPYDYIRAQQAAISRDFGRLVMDEAVNSQVVRWNQEARYTRKDFRRAAEDLHFCLEEALEFFPMLEAEFISETREIERYADRALLNIIWEKKLQRLENGPRASESNTKNSTKNIHQSPRDYARDSSGSPPSVKAVQERIRVAVREILDCKYPEPTEDGRGPQIRAEEVRDFEERMRKTAARLYRSLGNIDCNVQAFRKVIRDLKTMSQDLNLFPLGLWKVDGQDQGYDG